MEIVDNKPKLIKRSKLGSLTRYLKFKLTNQFKKNNSYFNEKAYILFPNS